MSKPADAPVLIGEELAFSGWNKVLMVSARSVRGTEIRRSVEHHGDAAAVLPYDPVRRVALMVRQLRVPLLWAHAVPDSLEVPAGVLDSDEPATCARREAMEEAGVNLREVSYVFPVYPMPGISTECMHLFLAPYTAADRTHDGGGIDHENEEIEVVEVPLATLWRNLEAGQLRDMKTVTLLQALRLRHPALFD